MTQERMLAGFALYRELPMDSQVLVKAVLLLTEQATAMGMPDQRIIEALESVMRDVIQRQGR